MAKVLRELADTQVIRLDSAMTLAQVRDTLASRNGQPAAVFDGERPATLITAADIQNAAGGDGAILADILPQLPPGILAPADLVPETFAQSGAFTALALGARGALLLGPDGFAGAVSRRAIDQHLVDTDLSAAADTSIEARDLSNAVDPGAPSASAIVMYCAQFRHRNELASFDRLNPPDCLDATPHVHALRPAGAKVNR